MDFTKSEEVKEFAGRNYVALCFGIALFLSVVMLGTGSNSLRAVTGLAAAIAGFAGLVFLRKRRSIELEGTPGSKL